MLVTADVPSVVNSVPTTVVFVALSVQLCLKRDGRKASITLHLLDKVRVLTVSSLDMNAPVERRAVRLHHLRLVE